MKKVLFTLAFALVAFMAHAQKMSDIAYFKIVKIQTTIDAVGNGVKGKLVFTAPRDCETNKVTCVYFIENTYKDSNIAHVPTCIMGLVYHDTGDGKEFLGIEVEDIIYENEENSHPVGFMYSEIKLDDVSAQYLIDFSTGDKEWKDETKLPFRVTTSPKVKYPGTYKL